ncbi:MAG TPA: hypothetical protein VFD32_11055 [Dehalococcoidia bacterium]|nr:hypothetical protein [Dehalococcoidia bacterium]
MQEPALDAEAIVAFAHKLEAFARTLDEQEQVWLADLVQSAVDAVAARADEQEYNLQEGETLLQTAPDSLQGNLGEALLTGLPGRLDNPMPPAAAVGPAAVNYVSLVFG